MKIRPLAPLFSLLLWWCLVAPAAGQTCAPTLWHNEFISRADIAIVQSGGAGNQINTTSASVLQGVIRDAAAAWNSACPDASFPHRPELKPPAFGSTLGSANFGGAVGVYYRPDLAPWPDANNPNRLRVAEWDPGTHEIRFAGRCGNAALPPGMCVNGSIDWSHAVGRRVAEHELGHAGGLGHDTCANSIMLDGNASATDHILTEHCQKLEEINCDPNNPGSTPCPNRPLKISGTITWADPPAGTESDWRNVVWKVIYNTRQLDGTLVQKEDVVSGSSDYTTNNDIAPNQNVSFQVQHVAETWQCNMPSSMAVGTNDVVYNVTCSCAKDASGQCQVPGGARLDPYYPEPDPCDDFCDSTTGDPWWGSSGVPVGGGDCGQRECEMQLVGQHCEDTNGDGQYDWCYDEYDCVVPPCGDEARVIKMAGPRIALESPAGGATYSGTLTVRGSLTDPEGIRSIRFYVDQQRVTLTGYSFDGVNFSGTYSLAGLAGGTHELAIIGVDDNGAYPLPTLRTILFRTPACGDTIAPRADILAPAPGATVTGVVRIDAGATDNIGVTRVELIVDGITSLSKSSAPFTFNLDTSGLSHGNHTIAARAFDACGNAATSAGQSLIVDQRAPRLYIDLPAEGAVVSNDVTLVGWATDGSTIADITFMVDGAPLTLVSYTYGLTRTDVCNAYPGDPRCPAVGWRAVFNSRLLSQGTHTIAVTARDGAGLRSTGLRVVDVRNSDSTPPRLYIDVPVEGATVSGVVQLEGWATDTSQISGVTFTLDGQPLPMTSYTYGRSRPDVCGAFPGDPRCPNVGWAASFDSRAFANGLHILHATATDGAGLTATAGRNVTISNAVADTTPPQVAITAPANGATVSGVIRVTATASDNAGVTQVGFRVNGTGVATATSAPYEALIDTRQYPNGTITISARAHDAAGNIANASISVAVANGDTIAPQVQLAGVQSGATVRGTLMITATASDNVGVTQVGFRVNGAGVATVTSPPYSIAIDTTRYPNGPATITARAFDAAGNIGTASVSVTISNP